jgi:phage terminase large subunit
MYQGLARNYTKIKSTTDIDIAVIEECETVSRESLDVLIPTIRKPGSEIWAMGNPRSRTSAVAQMFIENGTPANCVIMRSTYLDNPFNSNELINEANHLMATDYPRYRHVYLGEYLETTSLKIVPVVAIEDETTMCSASDAVVVGVDIARSGGDLTTIYVRKGKKIIEFSEHSDVEIGKLTALLTDVIHRHKPMRINVDATGTGQWVADALKVSGVTVCPVNFSERANRDERYTNKRTELYGLVAEWFAGGGAIPRNTRLIEELDATWYHYDTKNRIALDSKDDIKKQIGRSPDHGDGLALSMYNPAGGIFAKDTKQTTELMTRKFTLDMLNAGSYSGKWA